MKKIEALGSALERGAELEFVDDGMVLRFPYHSPRFLRADFKFLLEKIKVGETFFRDENYSLRVYKNSVKITLVKHESGHYHANFAKTNFLMLLEAA